MRLSPDELKVFMEEADEHIQLLDEAIIKLEAEGNNPELLQQIFRAAHTLKGSSAMLGHLRMIEVTHAMESLLDKLRNKKLAVNTKLIDALLFAVDGLKALRAELVTQTEAVLDTAHIVEQLNLAEKNAAGGKIVSTIVENTRNKADKGNINAGETARQ